ncbi:hypothetical protein BVG79_00497 [Ketogulonicigenium robustum]|uniref:Uncharacterized protein n=1 Tax=Ketogulonicigenium robustum TaxID=92947 RepID=A0A1W6NW88_9RHOB|nr:hypothetical protein BVG79_00028 [Ketogulonicigenium robustum]ARO13503.1 hypothetical protein BVG79_00143 [Ketogulonicigenium robustum]ARO13642.1 hypothetical protein BVG79_00282 [Ketogulonicigenium robustum]ARO13826.1 hypothetical protein BVG79_00472 [Ketogulonicigenium robustum]ARO13851.1 hypothetical protein BVG79_00497 [Ketogulonicigenium robustum]
MVQVEKSNDARMGLTREEYRALRTPSARKYYSCCIMVLYWTYIWL